MEQLTRVYRIASGTPYVNHMTGDPSLPLYPLTAVMRLSCWRCHNDGAILSIAYDNVHYKRQPGLAGNIRMVLDISTVLRNHIGVVSAFGLFVSLCYGLRFATEASKLKKLLRVLNPSQR